MSAFTDPPNSSAAFRRYGRFELRSLLGRSERTMAWLAFDPRSQAELLIVMPRTQPADRRALDAWLAEARLAARLEHPSLAPVIEVGAEEHWPFVAHARGRTLADWIAAHAPSPVDAARWVAELLEGLAFVHDAGFAHHDLQAHLALVGDGGHARLAGLAAAAGNDAAPRRALDPVALSRQREAAERDVLGAGVLLHQLLAGRPALDEPDIGRVIDRLVPAGRERLRLPRVTPVPLPEPLRAIVDRATSGQPRLRYHGARTLHQALDGWCRAHEHDEAGPIVRLLDRIAAVGHLPALPGVAGRAARLTTMERGRTHEMAALVIEDFALGFELLRLVNGAQVQSLLAAGRGPVLTVRRAIALLGCDGVRHAAAALRAWPGPLEPPAADALRALFDRVRLAGKVAAAIRPAGFDAELLFLVAVLQNLGRLLVQYHHAAEAAQVRELMRGDGDEPGMSEHDAACAVLGTGIDAFGHALARQWGFADEAMSMLRRLAADAPVRAAERDEELIRAAASCANEAVDALALPAKAQPAAIERIAQRYAKALAIEARDLHAALQRRGREEPAVPAALPVPIDEPTIPLDVSAAR